MTIKDINTIIETLCSNDEDYEKPCISPKYLRQELEQLALEQEHRHLDQEPATKNDLGVDAVSRQAVLELIADYDLSMGQVVKGIHALPSVTPIRPKGHWIDDMSLGYHVSICSNCNWRGHGDTCLIYKPKYCPNCGCRMVEP